MANHARCVRELFVEKEGGGDGRGAASPGVSRSPVSRWLRFFYWGNCASFCITQRSRTEFLCSEKKGTARGTRGRFFRCMGVKVTSQKSTSTLHRAPVGQGPMGPDWFAISFGFWSGRALATGTAWAGLCLIHHHHHHHHHHKNRPQREHTTHTKERTPVVHLALGFLTHSGRVPEVARGANARPGRATRAVSKNKQGASTRAAPAPPFYRGCGCGGRIRCRFPFLWKDRIRRI